jgi:hypothetical protein
MSSSPGVEWKVVSDGGNWKISCGNVTIRKRKCQRHSDADEQREREEIQDCLKGRGPPSNKVEAHGIVNGDGSERSRAILLAKQNNAKRARSFLNSFNKDGSLTREEYRSYLKKGWHLCNPIPEQLLKTLLRMHRIALPDKTKGGMVHAKNGSRCRGLTSAAFPHREGNSAATIEYNQLAKSPDDRQKFEAAAADVARHISEHTGRPASDLGGIDFMLSYPGQTPQGYHQDNLNGGVMGCIVMLTDGMAPEYGNYDQTNWIPLSKQRRLAYMTKCWETTRASTAPRSAGHLVAGSVLLSETSHIHRQPQPPATKERRTLFLAYETVRTHCDGTFVSGPEQWAQKK